MRNCPACDNPDRATVQTGYNGTSEINAAYLCSFTLFQCIGCGMMYLDAVQTNQEWFNHYYAHFYNTDDNGHSNERLDNLAANIASYGVRSLLDIGGMDGELIRRIPSPIYAMPSGITDSSSARWHAVCLSHTLEHIYDVPAMMERIKSRLQLGGLLFIEVPVWFDYSNLRYDDHWQHINKFRAQDLERLIGRHFVIKESTPLPDYREYHAHRLVAQYG